MKKLFTAVAVFGALLSTQAWALPEHSQIQDAGESSLPHRTAVDPAISKVRPAHLHTINGRQYDRGRFEGAPQPGVGRQVTVMSTAYCLRGFTARGTSVEFGTVAVDPRLIPMGSKIYIPGYGWGRALDTGGAIRGNVIDLWFPTSGQCFQWGCRKITVTVVDGH